MFRNKIEKEKLDRMVEEGWLVSQIHPEFDLTIYNYSQKTQYEKKWNKETLMCRGIVLNSKGEVVSRPFPKFFNLSEVEYKVPDLPFEVFEKMDGSLGIFFWYKGNPIFSSRGSFTSDQAKVGKSMLEEIGYSRLSEGVTYLFEIIYPENRIVVDYGDDEKLVLLGAIETSTGKEIRHQDLKESLSPLGFEIVKKWEGKNSIDSISKENDPEREGYVLRFSNGFRVKVKFEEYCRLHRIVTNVSNVNIWEKLKENLPLEEILDRVPDEFYSWVRNVEEELKEKYHKVLDRSERDLHSIKSRLGDSTRKEYAEEIKIKRYPSILFKLLDGQDPSDLIWKIIKPKWSKPFRVGV